METDVVSFSLLMTSMNCGIHAINKFFSWINHIFRFFIFHLFVRCWLAYRFNGCKILRAAFLFFSSSLYYYFIQSRAHLCHCPFVSLHLFHCRIWHKLEGRIRWLGAVRVAAGQGDRAHNIDNVMHDRGEKVSKWG